LNLFYLKMKIIICWLTDYRFYLFCLRLRILNTGNSISSLSGGFKVLSSLRNNYEVVTAVKIIAAVKLLIRIYMIIFFNRFTRWQRYYYWFIVCKLSNQTWTRKWIKQNYILQHFWNYLKGKEINKYLEYVDLRYSGHVYLGIIERAKKRNKKSWRKMLSRDWILEQPSLRCNCRTGWQ